MSKKSVTRKGEKVTVIGLGRSGTAAAAQLVREGAEVLIVDDRDQAVPAALQGQPLQYHLGHWNTEDLFWADRIIVSPGFPLSRLPSRALADAGIAVISEMGWAASHLSAPLIAITGTNGKSTTTTLVGEILKANGHKVFVGGNLGVPLSLAIGGRWDFIVAEVSSYQLEAPGDFHPHIAVLLNITPDHLDRYPDTTAYRKTKWRIFENQMPTDHAVFNVTEPFPETLRSHRVCFGLTPEAEVRVQEGGIVSDLKSTGERLLQVSALRLQGAHNIENALAAVAVTQQCGVPSEIIQKVLTAFEGLPHRMEWVRDVGGVRYINDSKGTNVGAVMKSLEGITTPVILIAGGQDKGCDFTPLLPVIGKKVKHLILLGTAREKLAHCFAGYAAMTQASSMEEAVRIAGATAQPGDCVLLSPACASFDQFRDYQHRGEVFKCAVAALRSSYGHRDDT